MAKHLIIVESPAKAKTLKKYLGHDFEVLASYGHVRDLLPKSGAVDPEHDFAMHYELIERNIKHVDAISKAIKQADSLYLATDPDREGEAISWHLQEILNQKNLLKNKAVHRVAFYEITKRAVTEAVQNPRELSMDLVNAQQARRALDYLVGFNLSPLLWKKIRGGLSAGRVQSPALRLIVERELEIENFKSQEYWSIEADCLDSRHPSQPFSARLTRYNQEKLEQFSIQNADQAGDIKAWLLNATQKKLMVSQVEKKQRKKNPASPFTTSTLQQEAARKLNFGASKTMRVAQALYEGIETSEGQVGLISYMRTDSVNLAEDALSEIRQFIARQYGDEYLPDSPRIYKTKSKNAQEAHEAIRPTSVLRTPESLVSYLDTDQLKLYTLIWQRTVACQMIPATLDTVAIDFDVKNTAQFRATGSVVTHPGYMKLYQESFDEPQEDDNERRLPPLEIGDQVNLSDIRADQHFTEPPPRYSEASLVKALEEHGIGRPSTYASILSTLEQRKYVSLDNKRFKPTDVGRIVNKFLTEYFTQYVDYDFTAKLEDDLDAVSRGERQWVPLMSEFWGPFHDKTLEIEKSVKRSDVTQEAIGENCPECSKPLVARLGKSGRFIGCTGYPDCNYTRPMDNADSPQAEPPEIIPDRPCPECQSPLHIKTGKYGKFIGCSAYPKCKFMEPLVKPKDTGVRCPQCHEGVIMERKSKRGKVFFSCSKYPSCEYALWNKPITESCPQCHWPILTLSITKSRGTEKVCPQKNCGYHSKVDSDDSSEG